MTPIGVTVAAIVGLAIEGAAQAPVPRDGPALADFERRVAAYVELHKRVADNLPSLKLTDNPAEIAGRETALGGAIRAARSGAGRGDIMTPQVAGLFQRAIRIDFRRRSREERQAMMEDIPRFRPIVNQTYPSEWPLATFPAGLLEVMPPLPEILEYRLLSESLILRDVPANIVVDFILNVY